MKIRLLLPVVLAANAAATATRAGDTELVPEVSLDLAAARYFPVETDLHWVGWIGAGAGLLKHRGALVYLRADVETVLGDSLRPFEANQANYHLEVGVRRHYAGATVDAFFHHVSRHQVDRAKVQAVDWNVLGVRAAARLPPEFFVPTRIEASLGHTTLASLVGYRLEMSLQLEAEVVRRGWGEAYAAAHARVVTARRSTRFPRNGFAELTLECGARFGRDGRRIEVFLAYEHRNDVFVETPGTRDRALVGFRLGLSGVGDRSPAASPRRP